MNAKGTGKSGFLSKGQSFRQMINNSFRASSFQGNFLKQKLTENAYLLDSFLAGERRLYKHKHGYALASEQVLRPVNASELAYKLVGCPEVEFEGELDFRICQHNAFQEQQLQHLDLNLNVSGTSTMKSKDTSTMDDVMSDAGSVATTARRSVQKFNTGFSVNTNGTTTGGKLNAKVKKALQGSGSRKGKGMVRLTRDKLVIHSLVSARISAGRGSSKRSTARVNNLRAQVQSLQMQRNMKHLSAGSTNTTSNNLNKEDLDSMSVISNHYVKTAPTELGPILHEFSLSRIYSIEHLPGQKEFQILFYHSANDEHENRTRESSARKLSKEIDGANEEDDDYFEPVPATEFSFKAVTLKAQGVAEIADWIERIYKGVENQATIVDSFVNTLKTQQKATFHQQRAEHIEDFLRLSIDLWTLTRGLNSFIVADAQCRLAEFLENNGDSEEEAPYWRSQSEIIRGRLSESENQGHIEHVSGISL